MGALAWVGGSIIALGTILFIAAAIWFIYNSNHRLNTAWYVWGLMALGLILFLVGLGICVAYILRKKKTKKYRARRAARAEVGDYYDYDYGYGYEDEDD